MEKFNHLTVSNRIELNLQVIIQITLNRTKLESELACDLLSEGENRPPLPKVKLLPDSDCLSVIVSAEFTCFTLHSEHICTIPINRHREREKKKDKKNHNFNYINEMNCVIFQKRKE